MVYMWKSERTNLESQLSLSLYHMGAMDGTQALRRGFRNLYPLTLLAILKQMVEILFKTIHQNENLL